MPYSHYQQRRWHVSFRFVPILSGAQHFCTNAEGKILCLKSWFCKVNGDYWFQKLKACWWVQCWQWLAVLLPWYIWLWGRTTRSFEANEGSQAWQLHVWFWAHASYYVYKACKCWAFGIPVCRYVPSDRWYPTHLPCPPPWSDFILEYPEMKIEGMRPSVRCSSAVNYLIMRMMCTIKECPLQRRRCIWPKAFERLLVQLQRDEPREKSCSGNDLLLHIRGYQVGGASPAARGQCQKELRSYLLTAIWIGLFSCRGLKANVQVFFQNHKQFSSISWGSAICTFQTMSHFMLKSSRFSMQCLWLSRIVQAQLGGSGRDSLGSYNAKGSQDIQTLLEEMPLKDGDAWIAALMRRNELLGN